MIKAALIPFAETSPIERHHAFLLERFLAEHERETLTVPVLL
jgi:hypothetical protein